MNATGRAGPIPYPNVGIPGAVGQKLFAMGGEVTVQMPAASAALYDDFLFLASPLPAGPFDPGPPPTNYVFWNHGTPGTVSLGVFDAGTELIFGLHAGVTYDNDGDPETPDEFEPLGTWYSGPADRNEDGFVHVYVVNNYGGNPNSTYVAFEDLNGGLDGSGSDWNYRDIEFIFTGVSSVPEPAILSLLALGLLLLKRVVRRQK
jgi:hypothetical protein